MSPWDEDSWRYCKLGGGEDQIGVHLRVYKEETSSSKPLGLSLKISCLYLLYRSNVLPSEERTWGSLATEWGLMDSPVFNDNTDRVSLIQTQWGGTSPVKCCLMSFQPNAICICPPFEICLWQREVKQALWQPQIASWHFLRSGLEMHLLGVLWARS